MATEFPKARPEDIPGLQLAWIHVTSHLDSLDLVRERHAAMSPAELARCRRNTADPDDALYPGIIELVAVTMHPDILELARASSAMAVEALDDLATATEDPGLVEVRAFMASKEQLFHEAAAVQDALPPDQAAHVRTLPTDATEGATYANTELPWGLHPDVVEPLCARWEQMSRTLERYLDDHDRP